jgi:flagellar hook assembly protein FlgD
MLNIYNIQGQRVRTLAYGRLEAGHHTYWWDGRDKLDRDVGSGVYLCKLQAGGWSQCNKIMLLR